MKQLLTILILLITAFYVLPVSNTLVNKTEVTCKFVEKDTDEGTKKEKESQKEFLTGTTVQFTSYNVVIPAAVLNTQTALPVHSIVETPPPDKA